MKHNRITIVLGLAVLSICPVGAIASSSALDAPAGWRTASPREEIRPDFAFDQRGGRSGKGEWIIKHDTRAGLDGFWIKTFPVQGGHYYRFEVFRKIENVPVPRRSAMIRLLWQNEKGAKVLRDEAPSARKSNVSATESSSPVRYVTNVLQGYTPIAEAEHPL